MAHALETVGAYDLRHGEAVAIGLHFAARLARSLGRIDEDRVDDHRAVLAAYDLPMDLPLGSDAEHLLAVMRHDKKALDGLTFVLDGHDGVEVVAGVPRRCRGRDPPRYGGGVTIVLLLSGPNLDLLGQRQPEIYGTATLADHVEASRQAAAEYGLTLEHVQSNSEQVLVDAVRGARGRCGAIVVNGGAFTHYAWSLHDALATFDGPIVELHLSNPDRRERWRHTSVITPVATAIIAGLGAHGYPLALQAAASLLGAQRPK